MINHIHTSERRTWISDAQFLEKLCTKFILVKLWYHTYPTMQLDEYSSKCLGDEITARFTCPDCSREGRSGLSGDEAITARSEHTSLVKSRSNFSSITSTFKSVFEGIPRTSGTFALPSCRRLDHEEFRHCWVCWINGIRSFSSQTSHKCGGQPLTRGIITAWTSCLKCLNSIDWTFSIRARETKWISKQLKNDSPTVADKPRTLYLKI